MKRLSVLLPVVLNSLLGSLVMTLICDQSMASPTIVDCGSFWKKKIPMVPPPDHFDCYLYQEVTNPPSSGLGVDRIYYATTAANADGSPRAEVAGLLARTATAVEDSHKVYSKYGSMWPVVLIYMGMDNPSGDQALTPLMHGDYTEPVPVLIFKQELKDTPEFQKQAIAHEMFHAFQASNWPASAEPQTARWWVEGIAEYFSNLVYPAINREWQSIEGYDADLHLIDQPEMYPTAAFFQSLGNEWMGPSSVVDFMAAMPKSLSTTREDQFRALSSIMSIGMHFHSFARQFVSGQVKDSSGVFAPTHFSFISKNMHSIPAAGASLAVVPEPFVITNKQFTLAAGVKWRVEPQTMGGRKLPEMSFKREGTDLVYNPIWPGFALDIDLSCKNKPSNFLFLTTSTAGPDTAPSELPGAVMKFEAEEKECQCKLSGDVAPALVGVWRMRNDSMKTFMQTMVGKNISIDSVDGEILEIITAKHEFTYEMKSLIVLAHKIDDQIQIKFEINGVGTSATLQAPDTKHMCLLNATSDAITKITLMLPGQAPVTSEQPLTQAWEEGTSYPLTLTGDVLMATRVNSTTGESASLVLDRVNH